MTVQEKSSFSSDTTDIWQKALFVAGESRDSTQRSLALLEATAQVGGTTLEALHHQGKQLEKIQPAVVQIHEDLDEATKKLRSIKSVFGGVKNRMKSTFKKKSSPRQDALERVDADIKKIREKAQDDKDADKEKPSSEPSIVIDSEHPDALKVKEVSLQTDDNLDRMSSLLDDLKSQAQAMSVELDVHNRRLDAITTDVSDALPRIQRATNKTRRLH